MKKKKSWAGLGWAGLGWAGEDGSSNVDFTRSWEHTPGLSRVVDPRPAAQKPPSEHDVLIWVLGPTPAFGPPGKRRRHRCNRTK